MSLPPAKKNLIQALHENKKITREQAMDAMQRKQGSPDPLEKILLDIGIPEIDVYAARADVMGVPFRDLSKNKGDKEALGLIPDELQDRYKATPIALDG